MLLGSFNPIHPEKSKVNTNSENHGYAPKLQKRQGDSNLLKLSIFCHPMRLGRLSHIHPSIIQRAPHSHHTKVLSKGPGGFCHICRTKALTTATTCSTQLRPKPGDEWEMKGKTLGFSVNTNWRIIWGYHLFSNKS